MALVQTVAVVVTLLGLGVPRPAYAQSSHRHYASPPPDGSPDAPVWTWWLGAGGGARQVGPNAGPARPVAELRAGLAVELTTLYVSHYHEIQVGPWIEAAGDLAGALGEGGLELELTKESYDGSLLALRAGAGYGVGSSDRGAAVTGMLLFGRRHTWGSCAHLYRARGWRAFATVRYWPTEGRGLTLVAGLEIDPSLLFSSDDDHLWDQLDRRGDDRCLRRL